MNLSDFAPVFFALVLAVFFGLIAGTSKLISYVESQPRHPVPRTEGKPEKANPDSVLSEPAYPRMTFHSVHDSGRNEALPLITTVRERLEAWRDDAQMRLERCKRDEEPQQRNLRENYRFLAELLLQAELALGGGKQ